MCLPTPPARAESAPSRKVGLVIWGALLAGALMFAAIAAFLGPNLRRDPEVERMGELLGAASGLLSIVMLVLSVVLPSRIGRPLPGASPDAVALPRTIIATALNEGAALLAVVVWMTTGTPWALGSFSASAVGLLLAFPSQARWARLGGPGASSGPVRNRMMR